ncbi:MAG: DUF4340 domain-containing protein [Clostridiales bacterium]|nr:DUF4340 domain-containing protein [Clostridiales bacterium]
MKSAKHLLIPFIVLVLLGVAALVFYFVDKRMKEPDVTSAGAPVDILYISPVDIASVNVFHRDGNLNVKVGKTTSSNGSSVYSYLGDDKASDSYSQTEMDEFVASLTSFVGCVPVKENSNLAEFGLDNPLFKVTVTKTDGTTGTVLIGNLSPDSTSCYICAQGSSSVYLVSRSKYYFASKTAKDMIDAKVLDVAMSDIASVRFVRKSDSVELSANCIYDAEKDSFSFRFTEPFEAGSSAYFDRLIEYICRLEANEYEDVSFDNLSKYGLSSPEITVTLKTKDYRDLTLSFSSVINGYYYGRLNSTGKIFKVIAEKLESIESPVLVLINEYVFYDTSDNIDSIDCASSDRKFTLKLDVAKGGTISDDASSVTLDGRNAKVSSNMGRSYAAMLYESIFCINIGGIDANATIGASAVPVTTITIYDRNHSSVVYTFYKRNEDSYFVCRNGQYTKFYVYGRELYNDGGTDTYDYGLWPAYEILTKAITEQINGVYDIPEKQ